MKNPIPLFLKLIAHFKRVALIGTICLLALSGIAQGNLIIYCSTTNTGTGSGTLLDPYRALASVSGSTSQHALTNNGTNVFVLLQNGANFREKWTFPSGFNGWATNWITISNYNINPSVVETNFPIISGDNVVTNLNTWAGPGPGTTYTSIVTVATYAFADGLPIQMAGGGASNLLNHQWFSVNGFFYIRWDDGPISGHLIEAQVRDTCMYTEATPGQYYNIYNIWLRRGGTYNLRARHGTGFNFIGCRFLQGNELIDLDSVTNAIFWDCHISHGYGVENLLIETAGTFEFDFCNFECANESFLQGGTSAGNAAFISAAQAGGFLNCGFPGSCGSAVVNNSANTFWTANCYETGIASAPNSGGYAISTVGSMLTTNNFRMGSGKTPTKYTNGPVTEINLINGTPGFKSPRYPIYMMWARDDKATVSDVDYLLNFMKTNYGFYGSWACDQVRWLLPQHSNTLQSLYADGHEMVSHSIFHTDETDDRAFYIKYTGSQAACTMTIANTNLTIFTNGVQWSNFVLNTGTSFTNMSGIQAGLQAMGNMTVAFPNASISANMDSALLTNVSAVDIKTDFYTNHIDYTNMLTTELYVAKWALENCITNGFVSGGIYYPNGNYNANTITQAMNAGFKFGRTVTSPPNAGYRLDTNDPMAFCAAVDVTGGILIMQCEGNANDANGSANHFTGVNISYSNAPAALVYSGAQSAYCNGTNGYFWKAANVSFDFSFGDWTFSEHIWPQSLGSTNTLMFMGTSDTNYFTTYVDNNGAFHAHCVTNGAVMLDLASANGTVTNAGYQKVGLVERYNEWRIYTNDQLAARTTVVGRLPNFGGNIYLQGMTNIAAGSMTNFFRGLVDLIDMSKDGYYRASSMFDSMAEEGCFIQMYGHGETTAPFDFWRSCFDAASDYQARYGTNMLIISTATPIFAMIRNNGYVSATDGHSIVRTNRIADTHDYRLRADSNLRYSGFLAPLLGKTNLYDLEGHRMTDGNGSLVRTAISIGPYEYDTARRQ